MASLRLLLTLSALYITGVKPEDRIPRPLLECYLDANNNDHESLTLPMTLDVFLDIIYKLENDPYFSMDMGTFITALLDRFWRDGIEVDRSIILVGSEVIPYTTAGRDSYKYKFLNKYMIPKVRVNPSLNEMNLTRSERCTLHRMISRSIDIWERGNEFYVCQNFLDNKVTNAGTGHRKSSCPIERGIISTGYGTVSLSNVLVAILTTIKPMSVPLHYILQSEGNQNETVDNRWTSLTGDLSELLITQIPLRGHHFAFGPGGRWNDTDLPVEHYMTLTEEVLRNKYWQFTDAEILGSIDGLMMAEEAVSWLRNRKNLRLSQLFKTFYSKKFQENSIRAHACYRKPFFENAVSNNKILPEQVENYALALIPNMPNYIKNESIIETETKLLLSDFNIYASNLIWKSEKCPEGAHIRPKFKINLITDPSWTPYETRKFLLLFGVQADVSPFGSVMSVIKGDNGKIITESDNSLSNILLKWRRVKTVGVPSFTKGLMSARDIELDLYRSEDTEPRSPVTIILASSTILTDSDISGALTLLRSIREQHPDMVFIYVISTHLAPMYVKLTSIPGSMDDEILTAPGDTERRLQDELAIINRLPRAIKPSMCQNKTEKETSIKFMNFANPASHLLYRIHPCYLTQASRLEINITNRNKGNVIACIARDVNELDKECKEASITEKISFTIRQPCPSKSAYGETKQEWNELCKPIYLKITGKRSLGSCTESICRMPDDIPFVLEVEGLKCLLGLPTCSGCYLQKISYLLIGLMNIFVLLNYFNYVF